MTKQNEKKEMSRFRDQTTKYVSFWFYASFVFSQNLFA